MSNSFQEQMSLMVQAASPEVLEKKKELIEKLRKFKSTVWVYGFCQGVTSLDLNDMMLALMRLDDELLSHASVCSVLLKTISPTIDEDIRVLSSKKSRLIHTDEYGDLNTKKWRSELKRYYKKKIELIFKELIYDTPDVIFEEFSDTKCNFWIWTLLYDEMVTNCILKSMDFYIMFQGDNNQTQKATKKMTEVKYGL